ncbi:hypothetical protein CBER1_11869 [Cercospora berteroae]|uniref:Uncharacterized protein n=1 Tax=Cercospora berteroae TaxID=357750 RepID=A0A2S6CJN9_9PEZI|nr:hypothetical protein CBER1_11869 [Cercospora berteroae]
MELRESLPRGVQSAAEQNHALVAVMFLGLLEIGDSRNAVTHFDMCQKLLLDRLSQEGVPKDPALVKVYRLAAECIMYNMATLLQFDTRLDRIVSDWGPSFQCLFPASDHELSPFLGGFHDVYRLMMNISVYVRTFRPGNSKQRDPIAGNQDSSQRLATLQAEFDMLENNIPASYDRVEGEKQTRLYIAKQRISVLALKIHLSKITEPATLASNVLVRQSVQEALQILRHEDLREPGNPALRWPLTILACAAESEMDLEVVIARMKEFELILDPSNAFKLRCSYIFLQRSVKGIIQTSLKTPIDTLLEPMCPAKLLSES